MDMVDREPMPDQTEPRIPALGNINLARATTLDASPTEGNIMISLWRRKSVFATVFLAFLAIVAAAYFSLRPVYRAQAAVFIALPDRVLSSQQDGDPQTIGDTADLETQSIVLASPRLIRALLDRPGISNAMFQDCEATKPAPWKVKLRKTLGMKPRAPCADQVQDKADQVSRIGDRLKVAEQGRSRVITVSFTSPLPDVAQRISNGVVQTYIDQLTADKLRPRDEAIDWLRAETKRVADRLQASEHQIDDFLQTNGVIRGEGGPVASEQLTSLAQHLALAEADRSAAQGRLQQAAEGRLSGTANDDRNIADLKQQLALVTAQLANSAPFYGNLNPARIQLLAQRQSLTSLLRHETADVRERASIDYQAADTTVASLQAQMADLEREVRGDTNAATQVASLQRDVDVDRELYLDMKKNLNQLETSRRLMTPNAHVVNFAEFPTSVSFPKAIAFSLTGLLLAGALATLAALLRDRADRTIRVLPAASGVGGLRVLAKVPYVAPDDRHGLTLSERIHRPSEFQEAIRGLYAECFLGLSGHPRDTMPMRSIMISSSDPAEGKSFIVLALGYFAAAAGHKVLIVEGDMRRPSLGRTLDRTSTLGLSNLLSDGALPQNALCAVRQNLDLIPAGKPAMNSTELLGGARMTELLAWASASYDIVLIDAPCSRLLPDARILAPRVDGILYCAQWGRSHAAAVTEGVLELQRVGGRVLGLVLDRVEHAQYRLYDRTSSRSSHYIVSEER